MNGGGLSSPPSLLSFMKVRIIRHTILNGERCRADEIKEIKKDQFNPKYMHILSTKGPKVGTRYVRKSDIDDNKSISC